MSIVDKVRGWSDANPVWSHALAMLPLGFIGGWMSEWWAGIWWAVLYMTAQEFTDQRAHDAIKRHFAPPNRVTTGTYAVIWHGWSMNDWFGGVLGGIVGSAVAVWLL